MIETTETPHTAPHVLRGQAETFLYHEARLLDERRFEEWAELFAPDGRYWLPMGNADPTRDVSLVYDDRRRVGLRIERLRSKYAFAQDPPSQTCRSVSNVEVEESTSATSSCVVVRSVITIVTLRRGTQDLHAGRCAYKLTGNAAAWKIVEKRVDLLTRNSTIDHLSFLV